MSRQRRRRREADAAQLPLDFETPKREAFALLVGACNAVAANEKIESLVRYVFNVTWGDGPVDLTLAELGAVWRRHRNTARRWVAAAVAAGLLECVERRSVRGGQRTHQLSIAWQSVRELALSPARTGGRQDGPPAAEKTPLAAEYQNGAPAHQNGAPAHQSGAPIKEHQSPHQSTHQSFPPSPPAGPPSDGEGWEEIAAELRTLRVHLAGQAIAALQEARVSPQTARAAIKHYRACPGAWDAGALYRRLQRLRPGDDPATGWVDPSDDWQQRERQRQAAEISREAARRAELYAAARERAVAEQAARVELAERWGSVVDGLSDRELRELLAGDPLALRQPAERLRGGIWRHEAIAALAARKELATATTDNARDERC